MGVKGDVNEKECEKGNVAANAPKAHPKRQLRVNLSDASTADGYTDEEKHGGSGGKGGGCSTRKDDDDGQQAAGKHDFDGKGTGQSAKQLEASRTFFRSLRHGYDGELRGKG